MYVWFIRFLQALQILLYFVNTIITVRSQPRGTALWVLVVLSSSSPALLRAVILCP